MKVTVIIPYKVDRGWLKEAIASVPKDVQLLVSQGEGNWPANFNKALPKADGEYIKFLHEDDKLTSNCIADSLLTFQKTGADFIHGDALEIYTTANNKIKKYVPMIKWPTLNDLCKKNHLHSATLMYHRRIFDAIGSFDETLWSQEEYEFNLRCLKAGFKIGYCNHTLAYYRRHPEQKIRTVSLKDRMIEKQQVLKNYE